MRGITFDTGALIALVDRRRLSMRKVFATARLQDYVIRVPSVVVAEWWRRGRAEKDRALYLRAMRVESVDDATARVAGEAIGVVRGSGTIDAIVMSIAALRGDSTVYTSDPKDLVRLRDGFPLFSGIHVEAA